MMSLSRSSGGFQLRGPRFRAYLKPSVPQCDNSDSKLTRCPSPSGAYLVAGLLWVNRQAASICSRSPSKSPPGRCRFRPPVSPAPEFRVLKNPCKNAPPGPSCSGRESTDRTLENQNKPRALRLAPGAQAHRVLHGGPALAARSTR